MDDVKGMRDNLVALGDDGLQQNKVGRNNSEVRMENFLGDTTIDE